MKRAKGKPAAAPVPTPYSKALAKAIGERRHEDIAGALGVTAGLISAWVTGRKPVPATRAQPLADELGNVEPEAVSEAYALIARQAGGKVLAMPGTPAMRPELALNRVENDIDSLRWFATVMVDVMLRHRPAEAADLLATVQRRVPRKFRDNGFLLELSEAMAKQSAASAGVPAAAQPRAKRRS
jgi:hypothetical protein